MEASSAVGGRGTWRMQIALLPGAVMLGCWFAWIGLDGGYFPEVWYPSAIGLLALTMVVVLATRRVLPDARAMRWTLGFLAAFVGWNFLSLLWAGSKGSALDAANELLLLLIATWLASILPWKDSSATILLGVWGAGVAVACAVSLVEALNSTDLSQFFTVPQYSDPLGYPNASAALAVMGAWPCLYLSASAGMGWPLRALFQSAAVFLVEFSFLTQSRSSIVALSAALVIFIAVSPNRLRLVLPLLVVGSSLAFTITPIVHVYDAAVRGPVVSPALRHAASMIGLTSALAAIAGAAIAWLDRTIKPPPKVVLVARRSFMLMGALSVLACVTTALVESHTVASYVSNRWKVFKTNQDVAHIATGRGLRLAATIPDLRYDYWRVALGAFIDRPLNGFGAGSYQQLYSARRQRHKQSRYAHDIWLRFLAETGAVGTILFLGFIGWLTVGLARARRGAPAAAGAAIAAAAALLTSFLVGASLDWLEEYPALVVPAFALPMALLVTRAGAPVARLPSPRLLAAVAAGGAAALIALVPPYLSVRYLDAAYSSWRTSPNAAFTDLDRARGLDPLSADPDYAAGTMAEELGRRQQARQAFRRSLRIERGWYAYFELALLDAQGGEFAAARSELARARALDADDPMLADARQAIDGRRRIDPVTFNNQFLDQSIYNQSRLR